MDVNSEKEVYFNQYCPKCKYAAMPEDNDHCDECLDNPVNTDSHKPVNFKKK